MPGRQARTLLALLAVSHPDLVGVDRLVEALWGDRPPHRPERSIATLVSRLRRSLHPDAIVSERTAYRLGPAVRVDLYEAAELIETAEARLAGGEPEPCLGMAVRGLALLGRGPVLAEHPGAA
ncbi:MAG TPA: winged helix-turn-helix domain-containing protein, partial [Actinophytocola sp.]|uniref:AfsR/SARP family transcriptional regulator n=1 Tax=Actinophytocola sp. TaxID=1872138 RepID=UPI002DDDB265